MKANIVEIKRFAVHDGDGIRTTVFFKGCPLKCLWCHNPETISPKQQLAFYAHKCIGCGKCAAVCSCHTLKSNHHIIDRDNCSLCGKCVDICPKKNAHSGIGKLRGNEIWFTILRAVVLGVVLVLAGI